MGGAGGCYKLTDTDGLGGYRLPVGLLVLRVNPRDHRRNGLLEAQGWPHVPSQGDAGIG
jgi:hypothetical protein